MTTHVHDFDGFVRRDKSGRHLPTSVWHRRQPLGNDRLGSLAARIRWI